MATRIRPTDQLISDTRRAWEQAPTAKERKQVIDTARAVFGYSYSHMTRYLALGVFKRPPSAKQKERIEVLDDMTRKVYDFKLRADYDQKTFTVKTAFEALLEDGQIPEDVKLSDIRRRSQTLGIPNEYKSPPKKFHGRNAPLHLVMMDYSKSEYFHFTDDGQVFMEHPNIKRPSQNRLYIGAAVDYYSRVCWFGYFMADGESSAFVRDVMLKVFEEKPIAREDTGEIIGHRKLLQGIPRELYFDKGPGNMSKEVAAGLKKLGIERICGSVEIDSRGRRTNRPNKKARGMIEKFIGDFKRRFEAKLWSRQLLGTFPPDFTLRDLNEWALDYCEEINAGRHPILLSENRWKMFTPALASAVYPPPEAKMYFGGWLPRICRNRLIQGATRNDWFIAPTFIRERQKVDVLLVGDECFLCHQNDLIRLQPQEGSRREMIETETGPEQYDDFLLTSRLAQELDVLSGGKVTMRKLPDSLDDDINEFCAKPRSADEIREKARYFIIVTEAELEKQKTKIIPSAQPPPQSPQTFI